MTAPKLHELRSEDNAYRYPIESVENAARTLLMLGTRPKIRVVDVAKELGTVRSTAHRMVSTLTQAKLLERDETDKSFKAGPALLQLARTLTNKGDISVQIEPTLARLVKETGETAHFLVMEADLVRFLHCAESPYIIRAVSRVGHTLPAHITSAGKCLLATLSSEDIEVLFPQERVWGTGTDFAVHDREHLMAELKQVAARGWAMNNEESELGLVAISTILRGPDGAVLGAIALSGPAERMRPRITELVSILRSTTEDFALRNQH
jgi:IclR family acetate operon transcriptional repressor